MNNPSKLSPSAVGEVAIVLHSNNALAVGDRISITKVSGWYFQIEGSKRWYDIRHYTLKWGTPITMKDIKESKLSKECNCEKPLIESNMCEPYCRICKGTICRKFPSDIKEEKCICTAKADSAGNGVTSVSWLGEKHYEDCPLFSPTQEDKTELGGAEFHMFTEEKGGLENASMGGFSNHPGFSVPSSIQEEKVVLACCEEHEKQWYKQRSSSPHKSPEWEDRFDDLFCSGEIFDKCEKTCTSEANRQTIKGFISNLLSKKDERLVEKIAHIERLRKWGSPCSPNDKLIAVKYEAYRKAIEDVLSILSPSKE